MQCRSEYIIFSWSAKLRESRNQTAPKAVLQQLPWSLTREPWRILGAVSNCQKVDSKGPGASVAALAAAELPLLADVASWLLWQLGVEAYGAFVAWALGGDFG